MGDGSGTNSYPPVGDPDRYDMIVQRGRALRRRRRYSLGAGAGGTVVALAVAVVLITGGNSGNDVDATEMAADPTTTTTTEVTTTAVPAVVTSPYKEGEVGGALTPSAGTIDVDDPAAPVSVDTQQCVQLMLTTTDGAPVAEGRGCAYPENAEGPVVIDLVPSEVQIGCPQVGITRGEPSSGVDQPFSSSFTYRADPSIDPGTYELHVEIVSGVGDGCAGPVEGSTEDESFNEITTQIELP